MGPLGAKFGDSKSWIFGEFWTQKRTPKRTPKPPLLLPSRGGAKGAAREGSSNGFYNLIRITAPLTFSIAAPFPGGVKGAVMGPLGANVEANLGTRNHLIWHSILALVAYGPRLCP